MDAPDDDRSAFRRAMDGVRPLKRRNRVEPAHKRPPPKARMRRAAHSALLEESLDGEFSEHARGEVEFRRESIPLGTVRRLGRGEFALDAEIDLHGMRRSEAERALKAFVAECVASGDGCVRIVHGKGSRSGPGGPVLKDAVHEWLSRWNDVLAFSSADRRHGGSGAVYVLLRRR